MILVKPSTEILSVTPDALKLIEIAGRTCYKSEHKITEESSYDFIRMILKKGHAVLEHASMTVRFIVDRGVSHEIVRHRLASYSQESTRYCDYNNDHVTFIIPSWINDVPEGTFYDLLCITKSSFLWFNTMLNIEWVYKDLRNKGWRPEHARSVLPNSLKTEIVMTANLREWRHFFKLRTSSAAHPQMREAAVPLLKNTKSLIPIVFDDILSNTIN